jgi:hypothetical protein
VSRRKRRIAVQVDELLDAHLLVTDGVEALGDAELAREARDGVLIETQRHRLALKGAEVFRGAGERVDLGGLHRAHQPPEAGPRHDLLAAGQQREAQIVEGLEVEDPLDPQRRAEEQRQHQAPRPAHAAHRLDQDALGDGAQGESGGEQEEGAPEVGAPDQAGRDGAPSLAAP